MEQVKCLVEDGKIIKNKHCLYTVRQITNPKKTCSNCSLYLSLNPKRIKKEGPIEKAINDFHRATHVPKGNIRFLFDLYKKIVQARIEMRNEAVPQIKTFQSINKRFFRLMNEGVRFGWLKNSEVSAFMQDCLNKPTNQIITLGDIETGGYGISNPQKTRKGRRLNVANEFLINSLEKDSLTFARKPNYGKISNLLGTLIGKNKYNIATLKGKNEWKNNPILKEIPFQYKKQFLTLRNSFIINQTLEICKAYFAAKGESFLPNPLPNNLKLRGRVKDILQNFDMIPMSLPKYPFEPTLFFHSVPQHKR